MQEEEQATSTALVARAPGELMLSDDEIRRTYRVAEALAGSGIWDDVKSAEKAFAKMVIGRDLGLSPAQSMQGIHLVKGSIQMHYATLGQFVRAREGYDFRAGWIKVAGREQVPGDYEEGQEVPTRPVYEFVWHSEEDPLDDRPIYGAAVEFLVGDERRGLARYTVDDALAAGLIKAGKEEQAWKAAQRNMLLARCMSNGVKWFVPEVMGGMPVYVTEARELPERTSVTEPVGDADDSGQGIDLGPKVEKIIARAEALGHRGLSNRAALEVALGNRAPRAVNDWLVRAKAQLDRFELEKAATAAAADDATEGGVPDATPEPVEERPVEEPEEVVDAQVVPDEPGEPGTVEPEDPEVVILRDRLRRLNEMAGEPNVAAEDLDQLHAEIDVVEGKLREKGVEPEQAQ